MWFPSWFDSSSRRGIKVAMRRAGRVGDRRQQARRLLLEGLEDRRLMAFNVLANYAVEQNPSDLVLSQIDAGSQLDMLVANAAPGPGTVRLGNADGTFSDSQSTGVASSSVATGDFTGDGIADLVATDADVIVQIGNGDGTFHSPQSISLPPQVAPGNLDPSPLPQSLNSVAVGDLNADGKLDLVVGGQTSFSEYYRTYGCGYYSCGYTGWWITNTDGYVNVLIGDGSGGFSAPIVQPLGRSHSPGATAIGDLNGDGNADVVTANNWQLSTLLGDGTGALQAPIHSGSGSALKSMTLSDIDGDGRLDTVTGSGNSLLLQTGQANGSFLSSTTANLGHPVDSAVVGDVNGDGKLDVVAAGSAFTCTSQGYYGCYEGNYRGQASVILGNGAGGFSLPIASSLGTDFNAAFVDAALADLTGDGLPELVTIERSLGLAIVAGNDGDWIEPVALSISSPTIVEGNDGTVAAVFNVTLGGPSPKDVTVDFATADLNDNEQYWYGGATATAGIDYTATAGTLTIPAGQTSGTITVPVSGDRSGEPNELFFVNLSNPAFAVIGNSPAVGTIVDDEPYVAIQYYPSPEIVEGNVGTTPMTFEVILTAASDVPVTVEYFTQEVSALAGSDYQAATGTVTFAPGETSQTVTVLVIGDTVREGDEHLVLNLASATNASIGNAVGYGYILDDYLPPTIAIGDASVVEGNSGTKLMTFAVSLSNPSGQAVSVNYATADNTAKTSNGDYTSASGSLYFAPGETTQTLTVSINGDARKEKDERFYVNLSGADGATMVDSRGVGTIVNDDGISSPKLRVQDASVVEGTHGTKLMLFTVTLSAASQEQVSVDFATKNGTAKVSGNDYVAQSGRLEFAPGETIKTVAVEIKGDSRKEGHEYLFLELFGASAALIADRMGLGMIRNDDRR